VDTVGDVAKRDETLAEVVDPKGSDREERRSNSEGEMRHRRMNPIRKGRGTVGRKSPYAKVGNSFCGAP